MKFPTNEIEIFRGVIAEPLIAPSTGAARLGATVYFLVSPQCVPPPYLAPSVKQPLDMHALNLESQSWEYWVPPRFTQVDLQTEQLSAAAA
jgi:hypothetical protein